MPRRKLPKDPRYRQQVETFEKRYGRKGYQQAGSLGGKNSPTKFDSDRARAAGIKSGETRRAKAALARKENDNGKTEKL